MKWRTAALGDLVTTYGGGTPRRSRPDYFGGSVPWITPKDMKSRTLASSEITLTKAGLDGSTARVVPADSVLVVTRSGVLKHSLPVARNIVPVALNQDIKALVPGETIDASYLLNLLVARAPEILRWVRSTTADNFPISRLQEMEIPLPPLDEQRKIARLLDGADTLRTKRQLVSNRWNELAAAVYESTFGDETRWRGLRLGDLVKRIDSGRSPVCAERCIQPGEWGVLKLGAVSFGKYRPADNKALLPGTEARREFEVHTNDILLSRKNTYDLVGASVFVEETPGRLLLPDLIFRLVLDEGAPVEPRYLQAALARPRQRAAIRRLASGSAGSMPNVSKERLRSVLVAVPPLDLQRRFSARLGAIHAAGRDSARHLCHLDALFASLQHRAFAASSR